LDHLSNWYRVFLLSISISISNTGKNL